MDVFRTFDEVVYQPKTIVSVGTYDGVHLGHQEILSQLVQKTKEINGRSCVITFDPHPKEVVGYKNGNLSSTLTTIQEKLDILSEIDIDSVWVIHFNRYISELEPDAFVKDLIIKRIGVAGMVEGYDHAFGRNRLGNLDLLRKIGSEKGFSLTVIPPYQINQEIVSSTKIRQLLQEGNISKTTEWLGYPYKLRGTVVKGEQQGRELHFPTANLVIPSKKLIPANGVYFVNAHLDTGKQYYGMLNIGYRPTFGYFKERTIEVHIFDFDKEIYGEKLEIEFIRRLRDEKKFDSVSSLIKQLNEDKSYCLSLIN